MGARSKARKRALDILFEADQRGLNAERLLMERLAAADERAGLNAYTAELIHGVVRRWTDINELLATYSQGWPLDRMPAVDRAILRVGVYEIVWNDEVPEAVAISEAVALAKDLSTDDSPGFINGLLARISEIKDTV